MAAIHVKILLAFKRMGQTPCVQKLQGQWRSRCKTPGMGAFPDRKANRANTEACGTSSNHLLTSKRRCSVYYSIRIVNLAYDFRASFCPAPIDFRFNHLL